MKRTKKSVKKEGGRNTNKFLFFFVIIFFIFSLDRQAKLISSSAGGCFLLCIEKSTNYGASFGLLEGFSFTRILLIVTALIVMLFVIYIYFKDKNFNKLHIGLTLLFAGTFANLFDRIFYGYVIDFIKLGFWKSFPAFNIADISNFIGALAIIIYLIKDK